MSNALEPAKWISKYGDYLYSIAVIKTGSKEVSEDIVQETFLSAIKAKESFRGESSEKTWLTIILKNKITDYYRKKNLVKNASDYLIETDSSFHSSFFSTEENDYGHWTLEASPQNWEQKGADKKLLQKDLNRIIRYCIEKLPPRLVPVFLAKFIDEEEADIICKDYNITPSNYWVIIHRAKVLIRSCLEKNWVNN
jgi:RNA polymerase sigma-70 factor (TIGR02943 family)